MTWWTSWRLALRLARRDLLKHKARAIIALAMVTLPVLGVVAADVLIQTAQVSASEGIDRRLGTVATAELRVDSSGQPVLQGADPDQNTGFTGGKLARPTTVADIESVIGRHTMVAAPQQMEVLVTTSHGRESVRASEVDVNDRLTSGLFRLVSGRWPTSPGEVVVNQPLRDRGLGDDGSTLTVVDRNRAEKGHPIVGTVVDATTRTMPIAVGLPGTFSTTEASAWDEGARDWLVDGAPITWHQVEQLNKLGVLVLDRHIVTHPGDYPDPFPSSDIDDTTVQVAALIIVMALIEVVLLAGPAFAVGARKQQRSLALLVSSGGTPQQARRVIIGGGLLLGVSAGVIGVVGGILAGRLLMPVAQRLNGDWLGPFDIDWLHVAAVAAFGLVSAVIACLVPAWIASRQNVVAVLAGRRGDAKPVRAFPWIGLGLFGIGVLVAIAGARPGGGELTVAWAAVICVLGMVLLVPTVVSWVARVAGRFPLPARFAARDAVRHRTRTTPAVAAVAATVAGVVALGIAQASDEKQNRETYVPSLVIGNAAVTTSYDFADSDPAKTDWTTVAATVNQHVPGVRMATVRGLQESFAGGGYDEIEFLEPGTSNWITPGQMRAGLGGGIIVSDGTDLPPTAKASLPAGDEVSSALASGQAVVFTDDQGQAMLHDVQIQVTRYPGQGEPVQGAPISVPAHLVDLGDRPAPASAILPPSVAEQTGLKTVTMGLELDQPELSSGEAKDLDAALEALPTPAMLQVERGYQADAYTKIVQWVLALLGAILMMGGTLTAMFLALSDARPDLATLAAVGAEARVRRKVAVAYTFVVGFVGAVLGMLVGFVPGLAITRPLTRSYAMDSSSSYFVEVPWLMIAVVVIGLPLLTAAIVGLCVRSKLPMVSRLS